MSTTCYSPSDAVSDWTLIFLLRPRKRWRSIVISSVCLSVRQHIRNHTRDLYHIFCACCLWPWLGRPLAWWRNPKGNEQFWGFLGPSGRACTERSSNVIHTSPVSLSKAATFLVRRDSAYVPRHILYTSVAIWVPPTGESVWGRHVRLPLFVFPIVTNPENNPRVKRWSISPPKLNRLFTCSLAHC